jgi:hypothetical protein
MKIIRRLMWVYLLLVLRVPLSLFFNMVLPLAFFVFYAGLVHGKGLGVAGLVIRLIALGALSNGLFGLSIMLVVMRERDILRRYHLTPISAFHVVASRLLANYVLFFVMTLLELGAARLLFGLQFGPILPQLLLVCSLGYLAIAGIGFVIAAVVNTVSDAQVYNQLAFFALLFLSGISVPLATMSQSLIRVAAFMPPSLMIVAADEIVVHPDAPYASWPEWTCLAIIAAMTLGVATFMFRWEKEAKVSGYDRLKAAVIFVPMILAGIWMNTFGNFTDRIIVTAERLSGASSVQQPASRGADRPQQ